MNDTLTYRTPYFELLGITLVYVVVIIISHIRLRIYIYFCDDSCNLPGVYGPCVLRREKLVSYLIYFIYITHIVPYTHIHTYNIRHITHICCYFVCTHNRIRSPRLAAFGRIEYTVSKGSRQIRSVLTI